MLVETVTWDGGGVIYFSMILDGCPEVVWRDIYGVGSGIKSFDEAIAHRNKSIFTFKHRHKDGSKRHNHNIQLGIQVGLLHEAQGRHIHMFRPYSDKSYFEED